MRKIAVMVGSDSDLKQCYGGLQYLQKAQKKGLCEVVGVLTNSIHRNTEAVLNNLKELQEMEVDVLIAGAGWANHLTGTCDAYLRNTMKNDRITVIGVAFGKMFPTTSEETRKREAATLSISEVPGTQVVFEGFCIGEVGFRKACERAVEGDFPLIKLKEPKPAYWRTLNEALELSKADKQGGI